MPRPGKLEAGPGKLEAGGWRDMDDFYDDPVYGRLELKRGAGLGGYEGVYRKWLKREKKYVWHAKYRPDLNLKDQKTVAGDGLPEPRDAAIRLAVHLAAHPPTPKVGGKVCCRALTCCPCSID